MTHHSPQALLAELRPLASIFPGQATRNWLAKAAWIIWQLEFLGKTHFGGPSTFAWWLVQRCQPKAPLTKAKIRSLVKMAGGSQKSLDLLAAIAENRSQPRRFATGWSFLEVNSYLTQLKAERLGGFEVDRGN